MRSLPAHKLPSCPGADHMGGTDGLLFDPDGNRHFLQMHADESVADINSSMGADLLDGHGVLKACISSRGKGTAGLELRHDVDLLIAVFLCCCPLQNQRPVQMLTALGLRGKRPACPALL